MRTRNFNTLYKALYGMTENEAWTSHTTGRAMPAINLTESESQYELEFAVPGMTKEAFNIQLDTNENLVVSTEKSEKSEKSENCETPKRYLRHDFGSPAFRQTIVLPNDVDKEAIAARVENGILFITLPKVKVEEAKPQARQIGIA